MTESGDCDDDDASAHPGASEPVGVGKDLDCDGQVTCYEDLDSDGFGSDVVVTITTPVGATALCSPSAQHAAVAGDCAPTDPNISPGHAEVVGSGVDEDCSGLTSCWGGADGDGDGAPGEVLETAVVVAPSGAYVACLQGPFLPTGDCDDSDPTVFPAAADRGDDGVDSDCDGVDFGAGATFNGNPAPYELALPTDGSDGSTVYWVDDDAVGAAVQDGSPAAPFATIQQALDALAPGDDVVIRDGTYAETLTFVFDAAAPFVAPATNPTVIRAENRHGAVIDAIALTRHQSHNGPEVSHLAKRVFEIAHVKRVRIAGLFIDGAHGHAVDAKNLEHVVIRDIKTFNTGQAGLLVSNADHFVAAYNEVRRAVQVKNPECISMKRLNHFDVRGNIVWDRPAIRYASGQTQAGGDVVPLHPDDAPPDLTATAAAETSAFITSYRSLQSDYIASMVAAGKPIVGDFKTPECYDTGRWDEDVHGYYMVTDNGCGIEGGEGIDVKVGSRNGTFAYNSLWRTPQKFGFYFDAWGRGLDDDGNLVNLIQENIKVYRNVSLEAGAGVALSCENCGQQDGSQYGVLRGVEVFDNVLVGATGSGIYIHPAGGQDGIQGYPVRTEATRWVGCGGPFAKNPCLDVDGNPADVSTILHSGAIYAHHNLLWSNDGRGLSAPNTTQDHLRFEHNVIAHNGKGVCHFGPNADMDERATFSDNLFYAPGGAHTCQPWMADGNTAGTDPGLLDLPGAVLAWSDDIVAGDVGPSDVDELLEQLFWLHGLGACTADLTLTTTTSDQQVVARTPVADGAACSHADCPTAVGSCVAGVCVCP